MKKIIFIADHSSHGGSLKMFTWLANSLSNYYDVTYCNLSNTKPFYELCDNVRYIQINTKRSRSFAVRNTVGFLNDIHNIRDTIKMGKYDLVINFADHALYALLVAKKLDGFKVLLSQRVDPYSCTKRTDLFRLKLYRYFDGLVCQTDSAQRYFETPEYDGINKAMIPNPALGKANVCWSKDNNQGYILSLARIDLEQKRQDILVKAMITVHREYPEVKVKLYGKDVHGSLEKLRTLIGDLKLDDCVEYCGVTNDSHSVLANARMMVLTSDYEGIPNAIIEAMEVGTPVISTDCRPGGARLLIDTEDKGIIVECNSPDKLADAIIHYLRFPDRAAECGANAHKSLDRFSEDRITMQWRNLIESL